MRRDTSGHMLIYNACSHKPLSLREARPRLSLDSSLLAPALIPSTYRAMCQFLRSRRRDLVNSLSQSTRLSHRFLRMTDRIFVENPPLSLKLALLLPSGAIKVSRLANDAFGGLHHCFGQSWMSVDGVREVSGGGSHFNGNDCFRDHFAGTRANKADA